MSSPTKSDGREQEQTQTQTPEAELPRADDDADRSRAADDSGAGVSAAAAGGADGLDDVSAPPGGGGGKQHRRLSLEEPLSPTVSGAKLAEGKLMRLCKALLSFAQDLGYGLKAMLAFGLAMFLQYLYFVELVLLYIAGLYKVDAIHSVYLAFALVFLVFPQVARRAWVALLLYCQFALACLWFFQFEWVGEYIEGIASAKTQEVSPEIGSTAAPAHMYFCGC